MPPVRSLTRFLLLGTALLLAACGYGVTGAATDIGHASATLRGVADRTEPGDITYWFEYGTSSSYGLATASVTVGITTSIEVEAVVQNLEPHTTYHYRLCVVDDQDEGVCGGDRIFTTTAPNDTVSGDAFFFSFGQPFAFVIDAASDWDGGNPRGTVLTYTGAPGSNRSGPITCLRVVGDRAAIGWDAPSDVGDHVILVDQAAADGLSRMALTAVEAAPAVCPEPPQGDFDGITPDGGSGFRVVDSP